MARPRTFDEDTVIARARDQFWRAGFEATSVPDLEAATGLKRSSLYGAFGDKRGLYDRALARYQRDSQAHLREIVEASEGWRATCARLFADAIEQLTAQRPCLGCFVVNATSELAATDATLAAWVSDNREQFVAILRPVAEAAVQRGELPAGTDPDIACHHVFALYAGVNTLARSGASREVLAGAVRLGLR